MTDWVQDPDWPERSFAWITEPSAGYVRPVQRITVRCRRQDGTFAYGVLICSLSIEQVLMILERPRSQTTSPTMVLAAYVNFYDQRGGGIETSLKGDKQGLGLTSCNKKRFEAQQMLDLPDSLAHNMVVWTRHWLAIYQLQHYDPLRMVRDVFHISGFLFWDAAGNLVQVVLSQDANVASCLVHSLRMSFWILHIVVILGQT